jgi:uncharacterized protein YdeI (YjbR/CyaY-like superfamily)
LGAFRDTVRLSFFRAALMKDAEGVLDEQVPNTRYADAIRFTRNEQVAELEPVIRAYLAEAMGYAEAGVAPRREERELELPGELVEVLGADPELADAFDALTPGRQRSYVIHLASAKTSETRFARIAKARDRILAGKGPRSAEPAPVPRPGRLAGWRERRGRRGGASRPLRRPHPPSKLVRADLRVLGHSLDHGEARRPLRLDGAVGPHDLVERLDAVARGEPRHAPTGRRFAGESGWPASRASGHTQLTRPCHPRRGSSRPASLAGPAGPVALVATPAQVA